jgi:hypothetical protein
MNKAAASGLHRAGLVHRRDHPGGRFLAEVAG